MNAFNIFQVSQFDENTFNNQITDFVDMLKDLKTKNPSLSNNELLELLKKKHTDFLQNMFSINSVRADVFRYHAIGELLSNPYEFKTLYEEVKSEIKNDPSLLELKQNLFFPLDLRECKKVHILDSIRVAHHDKQELLEGVTSTKDVSVSTKDIIKKIASRAIPVILIAATQNIYSMVDLRLIIT